MIYTTQLFYSTIRYCKKRAALTTLKIEKDAGIMRLVKKAENSAKR